MTVLIERLKAARRVSAPLIAIETADAAATIRTVVEGLNGGTPAVAWDVANGMLALNDAGQDAMKTVDVDQTQMSEFGCVRQAEALSAGCILFAHWDRKFWESPPTVQQVWNLRDKFKADQRTLVLLDRSFSIPDKLQGEIVILEDPLPSAEQISGIVDRVVETHNKNAAEARGLSKKKIPDADLDERTRQKCIDMARGMHDGQAELLLQMCLGKDGKMDLTALAERQRKIIEQVEGLTVFRDAGSFADVGGLDALKEYVTMLMNGRNAPKLIVWLDEIGTTGLGNRSDLSGVNQSTEGHLLQFLQDNDVYGILLAGIPGTGKSQFCKAIGGEFDRVVIRLDLDACKGSLVGESLHPDEEIYVCRRKGGFDFERMPISVFHERFKAGDQDWYTWTYSDTCGAEIGRVTNTFQHVRKERFLRVTTRSGRSVVVTEGHSLFTRRKMVNPAAVNMELEEATAEQRQEAGRAVGHYTDEPVLIPAVAKDLRVGDRIAVARNLHSCKNSTHSVQFGECELHPTEEIAEWFGVWAADGSYSKGNARVSLGYNDQEIIDRLMSNFGADAFSVYSKEGINAWDVFVRDGHWLNTAMRIAGMKGRSRTKRIPAWLFGCSSSIIGAFLRGYFSGDGSISGHVIEASTMSKKLAEDVMLALARLGIFARMRKRYCKPKKLSIARPDYRTPEGWQYRVCISKASQVLRFATKVGFIQSYKQEAAMKLIAERGVRKYKAGRVFNAVVWDEVESIEEVDGPGFSYDISVEGTEKFVAGGIIVHNSEAKLRSATRVIKACADEAGSMLWIATANSTDGLSGAMLNRFVDTYYFSLPTRQERQPIWDVWLAKKGLDDKPYQDDEGWNGRNIAQCVSKAWRTNLPIAEAAKWITPVSLTDAEEIKRLDERADGRYLSATTPGLYRRPRQTGGGRRVEL